MKVLNRKNRHLLFEIIGLKYQRAVIDFEKKTWWLTTLLLPCHINDQLLIFTVCPDLTYWVTYITVQVLKVLLVRTARWSNFEPGQVQWGRLLPGDRDTFLPLQTLEVDESSTFHRNYSLPNTSDYKMPQRSPKGTLSDVPWAHPDSLCRTGSRWEQLRNFWLSSCYSSSLGDG